MERKTFLPMCDNLKNLYYINNEPWIISEIPILIFSFYLPVGTKSRKANGEWTKAEGIGYRGVKGQRSTWSERAWPDVKGKAKVLIWFYVRLDCI